MEQLERLTKEYCKRHNLELKKTSKDIVKNTYKAEAFSCDWMEAFYSKSGRIVFKHNDKRTSIYK